MLLGWVFARVFISVFSWAVACVFISVFGWVLGCVLDFVGTFAGVCCGVFLQCGREESFGDDYRALFSV